MLCAVLRACGTEAAFRCCGRSAIESTHGGTGRGQVQAALRSRVGACFGRCAGTGGDGIEATPWPHDSVTKRTLRACLCAAGAVSGRRLACIGRLDCAGRRGPAALHYAVAVSVTRAAHCRTWRRGGVSEGAAT